MASDPSSPVVEEGVEDEEDEVDMNMEEAENGTAGKIHTSRGTLLTRRGITLRVLLKDKVIQAGEGLLSIHYLNLASEGEDEDIHEEEDVENCGRKNSKLNNQVKKVEEENKKLQTKSPQDSTLRDNGHSVKKPVKDLGPVRYSETGSRDSGRDPCTLVELASFISVNKFQPFNVAISSNVLLLVDFHCHLTTSEVVGYLGGRWDTSTQLLTILRAFPCRIRLSDKDSASAVEEEICQSLFLRGLSLVGWYHSHPYARPLPSLQDIDSQMDYQLKLQGTTNSFQPCLALICGPYHQGNSNLESKMSPFWVLPPPEQKPNDYGMPMEVEMTYVQDTFLTSDVLHEMMLLLEYYKTASDIVKFKDKWNEQTTYLDKVKGSLANKTPKDQSSFKVLEHIYNQLEACS
ncbi:MPN domain-containing protein isoform X2 [Amblyraja radiata]|uniref:MPN domain-containing protein isoform X2 n=1 Tax=Amblyraja radiata TaxID=386614 RepID=UPI001402452A|nr:MPN domain-containing protein isoform X2 [Amblyraja radiata]